MNAIIAIRLNGIGMNFLISLIWMKFISLVFFNKKESMLSMLDSYEEQKKLRIKPAVRRLKIIIQVGQENDQ